MNEVAQGHIPGEPHRRGLGCGAKVLLGCGGLLGLFVALSVAGLVAIGVLASDTFVTSNFKPWHVSDLREVGALEKEEKLRLLYSTGLLGVKDDAILLTDQAVVVLQASYDPPVRRYPFADIASIEITYQGESWIDDSSVTLAPKDGDVVVFMLSSERSGDRDFVRRVQEKLVASATASSPAEASPNQ